MSKKKLNLSAAPLRVKDPGETDAGKRAENEGMPAVLEGEGSRTAAHHYEEGVAASLARGATERLADDARRALQGPEAEALREAEVAARLGRSVKTVDTRRQ